MLLGEAVGKSLGMKHCNQSYVDMSRHAKLQIDDLAEVTQKSIVNSTETS